jgi:hypothetical protein
LEEERSDLEEERLEEEAGVEEEKARVKEKAGVEEEEEEEEVGVSGEVLWRREEEGRDKVKGGRAISNFVGRKLSSGAPIAWCSTGIFF